MTHDQSDLIKKAQDSIDAAHMLLNGGYPDFAASRAYYAMFYCAEAFLEGEGLSFSKHSAVIAAFGKHFIKTGKAPPEFHAYLIKAQELRNIGDYGGFNSITGEKAQEVIEQAERVYNFTIKA